MTLFRSKHYSSRKRRKKSPRQILIRQCDDLVRLIVRARDKVCQRTGKTKNLQVAHYKTRGNLSLRWDLNNVILLNAGIHYWWAHTKPEEFRAFMIERLGLEKVEQLDLKARYRPSPIRLSDLMLIKLGLEQELTNRRALCTKS